MNFFERIAEEKIRQAMQEGQFNDLPGRGKPLNLEEDPFVPEDQRLSQHVLKSQGYAPEWMDIWREVEEKRKTLRRDFRCEYLLANQVQEREALREAFTRQIRRLNRKILGYNVRVPGRIFEHPSLDAKFEMQAALALSADEE
ncbi:MAG TPA: DUF1992 domain-containing protein [Anaerolineaceae bacterium]|nr:DUF1992 domain-containing protein [Anaerolineaceae bacterium]